MYAKIEDISYIVITLITDYITIVTDYVYLQAFWLIPQNL